MSFASVKPSTVIPEEAGIHNHDMMGERPSGTRSLHSVPLADMDSRLRGNDSVEFLCLTG